MLQKKDRNNEVNFDIETAIRVLRQADYHSHALQLAERHSKHEWYLKIQLENVKDFSAALRYMQNLSFYEVSLMLILFYCSRPIIASSVILSVVFCVFSF